MTGHFPRPRRLPAGAATVVTASALLATAFPAAAAPATAAPAAPAPADAPGRPAVPVLSWQPCPGQAGFQCATAQVPLDYRHPHGQMISLALIKHPATDPARRDRPTVLQSRRPGYFRDR